MRLREYLRFSAEELLRSDLSRLTQATDYDTSWAARLGDGNGGLAYPDLLRVLAERQHADGSWGSRAPYGYDRLLSTLSVVLLLARHGHRREDRERRSAGERALWVQADGLDGDLEPTVGFEMIVPTLLAEGRELGLDLPYAQLRHYEEERAKKLALLPTRRLFETRTTALFSLEAFAGGVDLDGATNLLLEDGSMAGSPSATAWFLNRVSDWRARYPSSAAYVEGLLERHGDGLPTMAPCDVFARSWVLYYLRCGGLIRGHEEALRSHHEHLRALWRPEGLGFSSLVFPDSDDTAMALLALYQAGHDVDGRLLFDYERDDHFAVYPHELNPSISANLHILEALRTLPEPDRPRVRDKILGYVLGARNPGGYWGDKWHASAYYPTSQALIALLPHAPERMDGTLRWLFSTQRADGSWGQYAPTVEETALSLLALLLYHRDVRPLPREPLRRAARYLLANERPFGNDYPELWTAKVLYAPTFVIRSIVLAALSLHQDAFEEGA